jgi:transcriptional regulator with XRE-family HTH domain
MRRVHKGHVQVVDGDFMKAVEPSVRRQELGGALRALRKESRLSLDEASQAIGFSASKLSRVETGHRNAPIDEIASLLGLYRTDHATRARLLALAREADEGNWLQSHRTGGTPRQQTLIMLAAQADRIVQFDPVLVPGLVRTTEYAMAAHAESTASKVEGDPTSTGLRRQRGRPRRQSPELLAVLDESALSRPLRDRDVLRAQLEHLQKLSVESRCTIRVVPRGTSVTCGAFALLYLPDRSPVVVVENLTCSLFLEQPHDIDAYERAFLRLDEHALDEAASLELISAVARDV